MAQWKMEEFFSRADYPCYLLDEQLQLQLYNEAAEQPGFEMLLRRGFFEACLNAEARSLLQQGKSAVQPVYLLEYGTSFLTLLPQKQGCIAMLGGNAERQGAPWFAAEMREALDDIFVRLPAVTRALSQEENGIEAARSIQKSCYRMLRTNTNIAAATALAAGRPFRQQQIELSGFLKDLGESVAYISRPLGVPLQLDCKERCVVEGSRELLELVLTNLLLNSFLYTREQNCIELTLRCLPQNAVISVRDYGLGIKPEVLPHLFEPYYSKDPYCDTEMRPGLGLGLALADAAVHRMHGHIQVESTFGEGSCFTVSLPLSQKEDETLSSEAADYLTDRYSPVYVQLSPVGILPRN